MINLLPTDVKQNFGYAQYNTKLLKWSLAFFLSIVGVGVIVASGLFFINRSIHSITKQNAQAQLDLNKQNLDQTQKQVKDISGSLKLVVQVLSREILFSKLIKQIGAAIPPNAVLTNLDITKTQGAIDLIAVATDYNTATQVQINLKDPANKIFDQADIINIACTSAASATNKRYPCTISIKARFASSNPFLFVNSGNKP